MAEVFAVEGQHIHSLFFGLVEAIMCGGQRDGLRNGEDTRFGNELLNDDVVGRRLDVAYLVVGLDAELLVPFFVNDVVDVLVEFTLDLLGIQAATRQRTRQDQAACSEAEGDTHSDGANHLHE